MGVDKGQEERVRDLEVGDEGESKVCDCVSALF
jgi:hypothetical protein